MTQILKLLRPPYMLLVAIAISASTPYIFFDPSTDTTTHDGDPWAIKRSLSFLWACTLHMHMQIPVASTRARACACACAGTSASTYGSSSCSCSLPPSFDRSYGAAPSQPLFPDVMGYAFPNHWLAYLARPFVRLACFCGLSIVIILQV